ncbi:hypothetical protein [Candidatus Sulfurimonas baltica]|uniref:Lipoprotein n=1 Tax=Candidatus Sulfurimonas baltica TaxID=2740404 RepID=A0A7S7LXD6_9BACT|nr:hypothetical protein [Candidatus Sulfurimonas baltica]QOY52339.1 hypothetical protein HUE88_01195 [Candidatus Sulfurimonas baltica]
MKYLLPIFILFFSACSVKNYDVTQTKIIIIKSPKIKFSDLGYIRNSDKSIELELFIAGKAVDKISVNHLICTNDGCMSKSGFNKDYLNYSYPEETLQNILLAREIYGGKNIVKTADGFEQNIQDVHVDIEYKVGLHVVFFRDRKNNIIFKIKDTNE